MSTSTRTQKLPCARGTVSDCFSQFVGCDVAPKRLESTSFSIGESENLPVSPYLIELPYMRRSWETIRALRINTAKHAPKSWCHMSIRVRTIYLEFSNRMNRYQHSETTSQNNRVTVPVKPPEPTNYELQGTGWATRAPVAQTLQSVRQTYSCTTATCPSTFVRFPSCGIFTPTRTISK
jgi:hypothetical protein